jgi:hypothetical protein
MKRSVSLATVMFVLIALVLASGMGGASVSQTVAEPMNTPPPLAGEEPELRRLPDSFGLDSAPQAGGDPVMDQMMQQASPWRQAIDLDGLNREVDTIDVSTQFVPSDRPTAPNETCWTVLLNPQMDVVEFGDGTGSISHWSIFWQNVYYDTSEYNSPNYSLVMADDPSVDTDIYSSTLDIDMFLQGFNVPGNLTYFRINYSRLYQDWNTGDGAEYTLWQVGEDGGLAGYYAYWFIGESPEGWSNRYAEITDPSFLAALSGQSLALSFEHYTNRASSYQVIWLDDAQVEVCFELNNKTYLPLTIKDPPPAGCYPIEPDSVTNRGSTVVGSSCYGAFNRTDTEDYYSLDLDGATNVRLWLRDLPSGSEWTALIYRDLGGGNYNRICYIGTPGSADKYVDCNGLNPSYDYFVRVYAGTAPSSNQTYTMRVVRR